MIKNGNPRKLILFCAIAAFVTGTSVSTSGCRERCSEKEIISRIGEYESKEAGLRASIPRLAALVERCPGTTLFRVMWTGPGDYPGGPGRHALLYDRKQKRIGYEDDFLSGMSGEPYYAEDSDIRAVAEKQGMLTDLTLYERRPR